MGRPKPSEENQSLALTVANLVTVYDPADRVSRAGQYSVFSVFGRVCPWAVREKGVNSNQQSVRNALTIDQFNKLLEKNNFAKIRKTLPRNSTESNNFADPNNPDYTGAYAFGQRRWRSPANIEDSLALAAGLRSIRENHAPQHGNPMPADQEIMAFLHEALLAERWQQARLACSQRSPLAETGQKRTLGYDCVLQCPFETKHSRIDTADVKEEHQQDVFPSSSPVCSAASSDDNIVCHGEIQAVRDQIRAKEAELDALLSRYADLSRHVASHDCEESAGSPSSSESSAIEADAKQDGQRDGKQSDPTWLNGSDMETEALFASFRSDVSKVDSEQSDNSAWLLAFSDGVRSEPGDVLA